MGAGRTELAKVLFGVEQLDKGEVTMNGVKLARLSPEICIREQAAFITEDRFNEGLLSTKPVDDNLDLVKMVDLQNGMGVVNVGERNRLNQQAISDLQIKVSDSKRQLVNSLSGGNQQKVVFGKWVMKKPRILILDEPTRGVDVGAKFEIYTIILNLAKSGSAILIISSEIEELIGTCDRMLVMKHGVVTGDMPKSEFDREKILGLAL
jgi:ribose transport system ATP-binding protein